MSEMMTEILELKTSNSTAMPPIKVKRTIVLFENERYIAFSGFSSSGLLPNDRSWISTADGISSFNSYDEAQSTFVPYGWQWESSWLVDMDAPNVDEDGWTYSSDFASMGDNGGVREKGMMHFVRRKKMIRTQLFDVNLVNNSSTLTCSHCDLKEVDRLAPVLAEKLTRASLARHPRCITAANMGSLLNDFVDWLKLRDHLVSEHYSFEGTVSACAEFINSCYSLSAFTITALGTELFDNRLLEVSAKYFPLTVAKEMAKLLLRKNDSNHRYHCDCRNCGLECLFAEEQCPFYEDCGVAYSKKWKTDHQVICPHMLIDCVQDCGQKVKRKLMVYHVSDECNYRSVICPFAQLGCDAKLLHNGMAEHMVTSKSQHLDLSLKRIIEQQKVITKLHGKVITLEDKESSSRDHIQRLDNALAQIHAGMQSFQQRMDMQLQDGLNSVDQKGAQRTLAMSRELNVQIAALQRAVQNQR
jgi:hypothetical protein